MPPRLLRCYYFHEIAGEVGSPSPHPSPTRGYENTSVGAGLNISNARLRQHPEHFPKTAYPLPGSGSGRYSPVHRGKPFDLTASAACLSAPCSNSSVTRARRAPSRSPDPHDPTETRNPAEAAVWLASFAFDVAAPARPGLYGGPGGFNGSVRNTLP